MAGEAEACRMALLLASDLPWRAVEVESDSAVVVAALNRVSSSTVEVSRVIDDCIELMSNFDCCLFQHVRREANSVADRLAYFASKDQIVDPVLHNAPAFLQDVLYEDSCNATHILDA